MARRGKMLIRCARTECGRLFEAPTMSFLDFRSLFMRHGWRQRGSRWGVVYFCHEHSD